MKRVLRIGVIALLALALVANAGLLAGVVLTREPAPKVLTGQRIQTASRPAIVLVQANYTISASLPSLIIPDAKYNELVDQIQAMWNSGQVSSDTQGFQAALNLVLSNPDEYFAPGSSNSGGFDLVSTGSGFFVNEDGYLVTAAHVVSADKTEIRNEALATYSDPAQVAADKKTIANTLLAETGLRGFVTLTSDQIDSIYAYFQKWLAKNLSIDKVDVKYYLGSGTVETGDRLIGSGVRASVVSIDPTATGHDIAIMKAAITGVPTLQLSTGSPHLGQSTYAIGYPRTAYLQESVPLDQTIPATMTSGQVLLVDQRQGGWTAWGTSAQITPGDSGGPVLGPDGTVAGVISYHQTDATGKQALGTGFFVPSQYIAADLASQSISVTSGPKSLTGAYYHALAEGDNQRYKTELLLLADIQSRSPFDAYVKDDITNTQSQILGGNDKTPPELTTYVPAAAASGGGVALLAIVVWIAMGIAGRRRRPVAVEPQTTPVDPQWSEPATEMVSSSQDVLRDSEPIAQSAGREQAPPAPTDTPAS